MTRAEINQKKTAALAEWLQKRDELAARVTTEESAAWEKVVACVKETSHDSDPAIATRDVRKLFGAIDEAKAELDAHVAGMAKQLRGSSGEKGTKKKATKPISEKGTKKGAPAVSDPPEKK